MENNKELWDLFTSKEEYKPELKDEFNRNPYWASKNRNIFIPTVSEYLLKNGLNPQYPDNKKFALCLTHDIDTLYDNLSNTQLIRSGVKGVLTLNLKQIKKVLISVRKEINPNFHISETLKYGNKYNAKSSFYFLSLASNETDYNYDILKIPEVFDEISKNNGEIGLHGGHLAYNNISKIKQERDKLEAAIGKPINGYRNHYLHFDTPLTWEYLNDLNFKYDTTYGYADCVGFRNGMCHPFNPYSLKKNTFLNVFEVPLIIMDCTLWGYMRLNENEQLIICKKLIDKVKQNSGAVSLLWHNTQMQGHEGQLYNSILKYAYEEGAWLPTVNEVVDFWKENKYDDFSKELLFQLKGE